ncbi:hypothetical protein [Holdemania sp. 1001302B_160321_E10]|uniref:hypothetical protein n=1 Tax=Holdemania sp. 1001302B_160321_E10 TaxID=2787120 RepID=UPI00189BF9A1|nr:hypothetical protein [Holdemania sp. 1001302B_160321_E10]
MNLTKEEIELLINLLQNDELSFTNDFQTLIDKLTITKEYYEDSISGIIKCGYEMKSEELMEVFDLMVTSFPVAKWYVEQISEIRELIKKGDREE